MPTDTFPNMFKWMWGKLFSGLIKTFAIACTVVAAGLPTLFILGFGPWPYYLFMGVVQGVCAIIGLTVVTGILGLLDIEAIKSMTAEKIKAAAVSQKVRR